MRETQLRRNGKLPAGVKNTARRGRKASGARQGERVEDYPQLAIRVPPELKSALNILSMVLHKPRWRVLCDAIECHVRQLPKAEQELVRNIIGHFSKDKEPLPLCGGPSDERSAA